MNFARSPFFMIVSALLLSANLSYADDSSSSEAVHLHAQVANFRGFKQEQSNWCWAAITKTIYFHLTGAELDESELARVKFKDSDSAASWAGFVSEVSKENCHGSKGGQESCNHTGRFGPILDVLGVARPIEKFPSNVSEILSTIFDSLGAQVPLGIEIFWNNGSGGHAIGVYGASVSIAAADKDGNRQLENFDLNVFDPFDGDVRTILNSTNYINGSSIGKWTGATHAANLEAKKVSAQACPFLTEQDRGKFCAK